MKVKTFINKYNERTEYALLCLSSFLYYDVEVELYTYDINSFEKRNGIIIKDARLIYNKDFKKFASESVLSNHFRYLLLLEEGGWWVDSDSVLFSKLKNEKRSFVLAGYDPNNPEAETLPNCNVIYYNGDSDGELFLKRIVDKVNEMDYVPLYYNGAGYWYNIIDSVRSYIAKPYKYNPISCADRNVFDSILTEEVIERFKNTCICHMWQTTVLRDYKIKGSLEDIIMWCLQENTKLSYKKLKDEYYDRI